MNENKIVYKALEQLEVQTGIKGMWEPAKNGLDGELYLNTSAKQLRLFVEIKKELRQHQLAHIFELAEKYKPLMIVAEHIFPSLKEILRQKKIAYLDVAGNIYADTTNNFIWIDGNKPPEQKKALTNRAFTKTGLKTVFYILLNSDAINLPHRQLSEATGVALGNIKNVIEGLRDAGFILRLNATTLTILNKKALLERWITSYGENLKPTLLLGTYKFLDKANLQNWKSLPITAGEDFWGSEPAGELLTDYLKTTNLVLYTNEKTSLLAKWTLMADTTDELRVYKKFWKHEAKDIEKYAPPLLVYADLLLTGDPRCIETAGMIYTKYLAHAFE